MIEIPWWVVPLLIALGVATGMLLHNFMDINLRSKDWDEGYEEGKTFMIRGTLTGTWDRDE